MTIDASARVAADTILQSDKKAAASANLQQVPRLSLPRLCLLDHRRVHRGRDAEELPRLRQKLGGSGGGGGGEKPPSLALGGCLCYHDSPRRLEEGDRGAAARADAVCTAPEESHRRSGLVRWRRGSLEHKVRELDRLLKHSVGRKLCSLDCLRAQPLREIWLGLGF